MVSNLLAFVKHVEVIHRHDIEKCESVLHNVNCICMDGQQPKTNKNLTVGLVAAAAVVVLVVLYLLLSGEKKTAEQTAVETTQEAVQGAAQSATQGTLPETLTNPQSNPAEKLPEVNPINRTNPFKEIKTNPF